jgi:hypothetical protein
LRLLGPLAEFRRAVDRLRFDTARAPLGEAAVQVDREARSEPQPGQAGLFDPTD